jgi:hypothetical protein
MPQWGVKLASPESHRSRREMRSRVCSGKKRSLSARRARQFCITQGIGRALQLCLVLRALAKS